MRPTVWYSKFAKAAAHFCGRPRVFVLAVLVIAVWIVTGPLFHFSDTWQLPARQTSGKNFLQPR